MSRRRVLALGGAAIASGLFGGRARGQGEALDPLRIGFVLPMPAGGDPSRPDHEQLAGALARQGAELAEGLLGLEAERGGRRLEVLFSNAPDGEAAARAAERMAGLEEATAIVGGYGSDQFSAMAKVAEEREILFLNIGNPASRFREQVCNRYTFHVEAKDTMYLEALASWYGDRGYTRWFFVHGEGEEGEALLTRARTALSAGDRQLGEAGSFAVSEAPAYVDAINAVRAAEADLVVLLLDWRAQLDFMGLYDAFRLEPRVAGFPYPVSQTRPFYRAAGDALSPPAIVTRTALWEPTLEGSGAGELNSRFLGRWGRPMDGPAWAAYAGVQIPLQASLVAGSTNPNDLTSALEGQGLTFELHKGVPLSFRLSDHQLLQPLYQVEVDRTAETEIEAASLLTTFTVDEVTEEAPVAC